MTFIPNRSANRQAVALAACLRRPATSGGQPQVVDRTGPIDSPVPRGRRWAVRRGGCGPRLRMPSRWGSTSPLRRCSDRPLVNSSSGVLGFAVSRSSPRPRSDPSCSRYLAYIVEQGKGEGLPPGVGEAAGQAAELHDRRVVRLLALPGRPCRSCRRAHRSRTGARRRPGRGCSTVLWACSSHVHCDRSDPNPLRQRLEVVHHTTR